MIKLSIITVNLNNYKGLSKTLYSVSQQNCQDFEFIIIDGGSTDGSLDVIKKYADRIDYWISEPDDGVYQAMNKGMNIANGEYCIFMNSGDVFYNGFVIQNVLPLLGNFDVYSGNTWLSDGRLALTLNNVSMRCLYNQTLCHQSSFIRTCLLRKYKYDENLRYVADWKFWIQIFVFDNCTYKKIDYVISEYDMKGMSTINYKESDKEKQRVLESFFPMSVLNDYEKFVVGTNWEEKLYIEIQSSKYHKLFYSINVFIIKLISLLKKDAWIKKYPNLLD